MGARLGASANGPDQIEGKKSYCRNSGDFFDYIHTQIRTFIILSGTKTTLFISLPVI